MDPISAAGLGLSVTSLALQLFSGCIKGYQLLLDIADMPEKFEHLRIRLRLEQVRLLNWGEKVGLLEDVLQETSSTLQLHRNLIFDILLEVQRLFTDCLKLENKFGNTNASPVTQGIPSNQKKIEGPRRTDALLAKAIRVLDKSSEFPKRLQWATIKHSKFERLLEELIRYNDSMVFLLDTVTVRQIHEMQLQSQLVMLQLSNKIDDLRHLTQAMQLKVTDQSRSTSQHRLTLNQPVLAITADAHYSEDSLARLATFKADQIALETASQSDTPALIDREQVELRQSHGSKELATFHGQIVWIEWKEYDQYNQAPAWKDMIEVRVKKLAALLSMKDKPPEFRAPNCLGCFHDVDEDTTRYGLIYEIPLALSNNTKPRSLLDLIKHHRQPSLTQRIRLAFALSRSLMYLHSVNWLHKGIRSDNVIFFSTDNEDVDLGSPIISGFEYARPDLPSEMTEKPQQSPKHDVYRHPHSLSRPDARSQKSWDIYSLGIVLIEIAQWKNIDKIMNIDLNQDSARSKVRKVRNALLEEDVVSNVGAVCGERYQAVVHRCISGDDLGKHNNADESNPGVGADMLDAFSRDVVGVLQSIQT